MEVVTEKRSGQVLKYVRFFSVVSLFIITICAILLFFFYIYMKTLPPLPLAVPQSTIYYAADGSVIGESHSGQKRYWVDLEHISPHLVDATIAIEDKRFYRHIGIDVKRIGGAVIADMKAMSKVQGASTITQQYARNLFLEHNKSWKRKLTEVVYALRLEMHYSKDDILEGYLNTINYGHGAYGIEAASQFYYGKKALDLSLAEATMLAGIPKGPSRYSPLVSIDKATERQRLIIDTMATNGVINGDIAQQAATEKLDFLGKHQFKRNEIAPYFQDAVVSALKKEQSLNEQAIALGGLRIFTTLQLDEQRTAEKITRETIPTDSMMQVGFVAMNPANGHVTALLGGTNYEESPFNRATQALRQPGSTLKPLLYYSALEYGLTPSSTMRSEQTTFQFGENQASYTPANFNGLYADGEITLAQALALSDNVYAVKTHLLLGENTLSETAKRFGITTEMEEVPSLALGTSDVHVIEMAQAFSLFANGGKQIEPTFIKKIEDYRGKIIYEQKNVRRNVLDPRLAFVMTHMMTGIFDPKLNGYTAVTGRTMTNEMTRPYAGKSGTTNTDNWMVGFSAQRSVAVWTGYDKGRNIELTAEKSYAKNIWIDFMEKSHEGLPVKGFKAPPGTIGVYVNPQNGLLATNDCPVKRLTYFVEGTEPVTYCQDHDHSEQDDDPVKRAKEREKPPWYKRIFRWTNEPKASLE